MNKPKVVICGTWVGSSWLEIAGVGSIWAKEEHQQNHAAGAVAVPISLPVIRVSHGLGLHEQSWLQVLEGGLAA